MLLRSARGRLSRGQRHQWQNSRFHDSAYFPEFAVGLLKKRAARNVVVGRLAIFPSVLDVFRIQNSAGRIRAGAKGNFQKFDIVSARAARATTNPKIQSHFQRRTKSDVLSRPADAPDSAAAEVFSV